MEDVARPLIVLPSRADVDAIKAEFGDVDAVVATDLFSRELHHTGTGLVLQPTDDPVPAGITAVLARARKDQDVIFTFKSFRLPNYDPERGLADWLRENGEGVGLLMRESFAQAEPLILKAPERDNGEGLDGFPVEAEEFGPVVPLLNDVPAPPFPMSMLPEALRGIVPAVAESLEVTPDLVAHPMIGVTQGAIAGKGKVVLRQDWQEALGLYIATILPSGEKKSAAHSFAHKPVPLWQSANRPDARARRLIWSAEERRVRERIEEALEEGDEEAVYESERWLEANPRPDTVEFVIEGDITPEGCHEHVRANGPRLMILDDEGRFMDAAIGMYASSGKGSPPRDQIFRKGYDDGAYARTRAKEAGLIHVPRVSLSIHVMPQPNVIERMRENEAMMLEGLANRFLFVCPESRYDLMTFKAQDIDGQVAYRWRSIVHRLLDWSPSYPQMIQIEPEAIARFQEWALDARARLDGTRFRGWISKHPGRVLRYAANVASVDEAPGATVTTGHMRIAMTAGDYWIEHVQRTFGDASIDNARVADAYALVEHLRKPTTAVGEDGATSWGDMRIGPGRFRQAPGKIRLREAIETLVDHRVVRVVSESRKGEPRVLLNPEVRERGLAKPAILQDTGGM